LLPTPGITIDGAKAVKMATDYAAELAKAGMERRPEDDTATGHAGHDSGPCKDFLTRAAADIMDKAEAAKPSTEASDKVKKLRMHVSDAQPSAPGALHAPKKTLTRICCI
jgi:hypothetical protein